MASKVTMKFLINELLMTYGTKQDKDELLQLWTKFFAHVPDEVLESAVDEHLMNDEFFPKIADIYKHFDSEDDTPEQAWHRTLVYAREMAAYHGVAAGLSISPTSDPEPQPPSEAIAQVLDSMRWSEIAYAEERNMPFLRKEFMEIYEFITDERRKKRRAAIRAGDPKVIRSLSGEEDLTPEERRRRILAQGMPSSTGSGDSGDVSDDSSPAPEFSDEEVLDILDGRVIRSAGDLFG